MSVIVLIVMTMISNRAHAQIEYTTISKNINPEAKSLYHDLSPQGDSLYLKSESIFYKVTFLNRLDKKVYNFNPPVLENKIPLHDIIVGDYTVLVYKKDRIIVFHVSRLHEIEKPSELITAKEIHLSEEPIIENPVVSKVTSKGRTAAEINMSKIKMDENFELSMKELKLAINQNELNSIEMVADNTPQPYNLSSMDRSNIQSRDDYRRNNLRPNGKPYH